EAALLLLRYGLPHESLLVHQEALRVLRGLQHIEARKVVTEATTGLSWNKRLDALRVLRAWPHGETRSAFLEALDDRQWQVRAEAVRGLTKHRHRLVVKALIDRLAEEKGRMREDIRDALVILTGEKIRPDASEWRAWWRQIDEGWQPPEVKSEEMGTRKRLGTAVRKGLYGQIVSERACFLLDSSGSMLAGTELEGNRFDIASRELIRVLETQLDPRSEFNLVVFADEALRMAPNLQRAKGSTVGKAIRYIEARRAGGETNTFEALKLAFSDSGVDTIYLLSDGQPTVGEETIPTLILDAVQLWNRYRGVRVHCIGFFPGDARNQDKLEARDFLRQLARRNQGKYTEIE
ncbi:MAG TPA: VWA domain-containing protein, partial [Planctomycetes bacterium]|nr:VWA domain-containing protein [Planctomycetota bacterium]